MWFLHFDWNVANPLHFLSVQRQGEAWRLCSSAVKHYERKKHITNILHPFFIIYDRPVFDTFYSKSVGVQNQMFYLYFQVGLQLWTSWYPPSTWLFHQPLTFDCHVYDVWLLIYSAVEAYIACTVQCIQPALWCIDTIMHYVIGYWTQNPPRHKLSLESWTCL